MIWFNIKKLEKLIVQDKVTDKLAFNYLLINLIIITITGYISNEDTLWLGRIQIIANLIVLIWGVRKTFEINREGDNKDYFKRFISISFVAGVRVVVFGFIILFLFNLLLEICNALGVSIGLSAFHEEILLLVGFLVAMGFYYYMLLSSFRRVNNAACGKSRIEAI